MNLRDPVIYRILHASHHRTGDKWCIYPMYDFAHGQSDTIEGITHSLCSLEYEIHRPLYDWFLDELEIYHPRQIEFARLNLTYTVMSKRKLLELVEEGLRARAGTTRACPRWPGLRRRGTRRRPSAISATGSAWPRRTAWWTSPLLEHCLREDLNKRAPRVMARPQALASVVIENYPEGQVEEFAAANNPEDSAAGTRKVPFSRDALHRAGRLPRGPAAQVLPPGAGQGSPPALRLLREMRGHGEGRPGETSQSCAAPTTRPRRAAMRRTAAR